MSRYDQTLNNGCVAFLVIVAAPLFLYWLWYAYIHYDFEKKCQEEAGIVVVDQEQFQFLKQELTKFQKASPHAKKYPGEFRPKGFMLDYNTNTNINGNFDRKIGVVKDNYYWKYNGKTVAILKNYYINYPNFDIVGQRSDGTCHGIYPEVYDFVV
ncbi:hypothetical protein [Parasphingorhabdus sp.]|uniref:hypothetical protein n=1 Tax=Parasphingorhabdus sp. TaxID=2709688 RepID=UPI0039E3C107